MTTSADSMKRFTVAFLCLLVAVGVFLRVHGAGAYYYNPDETLHTAMAQGASLTDVWDYSKFEMHPPLGNFLRHYWMMISAEPAFVRGESLLFGTLLILVFYRIGTLIGDEFTGLVCATLITFSHACIIYSYTARNYMFLIFFLSCALYFYLRWRTGHATSDLMRYTLFGLLACFTHFSGIFCIACIAACEALLLLGLRDWRSITGWSAANLIIALAAVAIYRVWHPLLDAANAYNAQMPYLTIPLKQVILSEFAYDYELSAYLLWGSMSACVILLAMLIYFPVACLEKKGSPRAVYLHAVLGITLSYALYFFKIYIAGFLRHSLWILPLFLPAAGYAISEALAWGGRKFIPRELNRWIETMSAALCAFGLVSYLDYNRFSDKFEYTIPQRDWSDVSQFLEKLGPDDLIFIEKDDGMLLTTLYPYMHLQMPDAHLAALAPYHRSRILFNQYYARILDQKSFIGTLEAAAKDGLLKGTGQVVFFKTIWSLMPVTDLMLCGELHKTVTLFPPLAKDRPLTRADIYNATFAVMSVPTQSLMDELIAPGGEARGCLDSKNDAIPTPNWTIDWH